MAQKESSHKEIVDDLTNQLSQVRKQYEELQVLSRDQVRTVYLLAVGPQLHVILGPQHEHGT